MSRIYSYQTGSSALVGKRSTDWVDENEPKSGIFRAYWKEDGIGISLKDEGYGLRYEWYYKDNKRADGISKGWWPNGKIKQIRTWKDGKQNGLEIGWWESGLKMSEGNRKNDKKNGPYTKWYTNGQKISEEIYKDGEPFLFNSWNEDGKMMVKDGNGLWIRWYSNGQKMWERNYKGGKQDELQTYWYENRQKKYEETWKNGKKVGLHTQWYENGKKKEELTFS